MAKSIWLEWGLDLQNPRPWIRGDKGELAVEQDGSEIAIDNEGSQEEKGGQDEKGGADTECRYKFKL